MRSLTALLAVSTILLFEGVALAQENLDALNARVVELYQKGDYAAAAKVAEQAVEAAERQFGKGAVQTAAPVNNLALLHKFQHKFADAESLFKRAIEINETHLGPNHPETATSLNNLAELYEAQGQPRLAEPLYERAVAIDEKTRPDHPDTAASLSNLAGFHDNQGRFELAENLYKRSLAILEKSVGLDDPSYATSLNNLAMLYDNNWLFEAAQPLHKRARKIYEESFGLEHPLTAMSLNNLGLSYSKQGRYALAEPLYLEALTIRKKTVGPGHPDTAGTLNNLAILYAAQGRLQTAESHAQQALAIYEETLGPAHPLAVAVANNVGMFQRNQGKHVQALKLYLKVLTTVDATVPDHPGTVTTLGNLASLLASGGDWAAAEPVLQRALAIEEKRYGPNHPNVAVGLNNLALIYKGLGRYPQAEPLLRRALDIRQVTLGLDHPDIVMSLNSMASLEAARGRFPAAADLTDRARRGTRRHAARVLPALSTAEQVVFLRTHDEHNLHAALTLGLLQKSAPEIARLSAGWLANGKAVGQEAASQQIILARQSANPSTATAVATLTRVRSDLAKLAQMTPSPEEAAAYRKKLAELQAEEHRLVHEIGGQLAVLDRDEPWIEIGEIRKNIPAGSVLVDIARFGSFDFTAKGNDSPWQPARYAAWVIPPVGKGDITILDLGEAESIDTLVAAYRKGIDAVSGKNGFARGHFTLENELRATARPVTQAVLEPILAAVDKAGLTATEIILSPDGALWLLPWQALPLGDGEDAPYAIEQFAFRTVTSGRDLVPPPDDARPTTQSARGPVVVADPSFDATPPAAAGSDGPAEPTRGLAPAGRRLPRVDRLAATLAEARASAAALQKIFSREPKTLTGTAASEENVKREAVRPPALVLATHGYVLPDQVTKRDDSASLAGSGFNRSARAVTTTGEPIEDPLLRCGLLLAGANLTNSGKTLPGDDGILTGAEIVGLDLLGTDLVVLSACQTGEGQVNTGEGVAGLRQAFQIAGAQSVVATLWTVPDAESAWIMAGFYENVARGSPPSQALREAQLAFIKQRRADRNYESAHPYHWAAYGVTGR